MYATVRQMTDNIFWHTRYNKILGEGNKTVMLHQNVCCVTVSGRLTGAKYTGEPRGFVRWVIKTHNQMNSPEKENYDKK